MTDWRVDLDAYAGPLDLLLFLIKEAEVDIYDIPIAVITDRFLEHLEQIQKIDLNRAGEFLVVASQLMEVKAKMLLPRETIDLDDVEDPRSSLVQELLEYKRYKEASKDLERRLEVEQLRFGRLPEPEEAIPEEGREEEIEDLDVFALLTAFGKIRKEILDAGEPSIIYDDVPVRVHMERILERLRERHAITFREIVLERRDRHFAVGVFLALLELVRGRLIRARQAEASEDILITLREDLPPDAPLPVPDAEAPPVPSALPAPPPAAPPAP